MFVWVILNFVECLSHVNFVLISFKVWCFDVDVLF
uniref:Macaca fascicularis brain cDNA clone: QmoA-11824, similar to human zinc finger protein 207 (ZNF207), mRNA, RefSeq: NM_003457.1 n=1 Tax=Macaca fascicularis TaxID=9541 RepID=I7GEA0_MACFA|nr:unnamed protein product [Macaca fascicularis]